MNYFRLFPTTQKKSRKSNVRVSFFSVYSNTQPKINTYQSLQISTTSVELDPVFVEIARNFFGHEDREGRTTTHVEDGAEFLRHVVKKGKATDLWCCTRQYN